MPNIGAFIAWGLIAALFIADGWLPNETIAGMVSPMLQYLLPLTAIEDFREKGKTDPLFARLADFCDAHNGL